MPKTNLLPTVLGLLALTLPVAGCQVGPASSIFDGYYTGETKNVTDGVGNCPTTQTGTPMRVTGGQVLYGDFKGHVGADGSLQMDTWRDSLTGSFKNSVSGQFSGETFLGKLELRQPPPSKLVCTYKLELSR